MCINIWYITLNLLKVVDELVFNEDLLSTVALLQDSDEDR
jgi:hypothetical protein